MKINNIEKITFWFLALLIIFIFSYNIINYDASSGYDGEAHHGYVDHVAMHLPREVNLPTVEDTREYFNPPVAYIFPSVVKVLCRNIIDSEDFYRNCQPIYKQLSQIFQSFLFFISLLFYMKIFQLIKGFKSISNLNVLLVIGLLTVNYRAFLMIRGEPYIILFSSIMLYRFLLLLENNLEYSKKDYLIFGLLIALLGLSRQWAFLLFPGFFICIFFFDSREKKIKLFKFLASSFIIGFFGCSWFYFKHLIDYGSFFAFNMSTMPFNFSNQPKSFYLPNLESIRLVFQKPIRPNFLNQYIPIVYSDLWGDYWGYFSFTRDALETGRNQHLIGDYLARVNIFSLVPSLIFLSSFMSKIKIFKSKNKNKYDHFYIYIIFSIVITFLGNIWFVIKHPTLLSGDTIKAIYLLQGFHMIGILTISYLEDLKEKSFNRYILFVCMLLAVFIHNFSAMLTHY